MTQRLPRLIPADITPEMEAAARSEAWKCQGIDDVLRIVDAAVNASPMAAMPISLSVANLSKGDPIFIATSSRRGGRYDGSLRHIEEAEVTKVGRKWIYLQEKSSRLEQKFDRETGEPDGYPTYASRAFPSPEAAESHAATMRSWRRLSLWMSRCHAAPKHLSAAQMDAIGEILGMPLDEDES